VTVHDAPVTGEHWWPVITSTSRPNRREVNSPGLAIVALAAKNTGREP